MKCKKSNYLRYSILVGGNLGSLARFLNHWLRALIGYDKWFKKRRRSAPVGGIPLACLSIVYSLCMFKYWVYLLHV